MPDIKPGDKFNVRHEQRGDGQWVWSGPYECIYHHDHPDGTSLIRCKDNIGRVINFELDKCVKVD